jgi:hypothetical protein
MRVACSILAAYGKNMAVKSKFAAKITLAVSQWSIAVVYLMKAKLSGDVYRKMYGFLSMVWTWPVHLFLNSKNYAKT